MLLSLGLLLLSVSKKCYSQRQELLNTDKVLVRFGVPYQLVSPGDTEAVSNTKVGECNLDPLDGRGDDIYETTNRIYYYQMPASLSLAGQERNFDAIGLSTLDIGTFIVSERYLMETCTENCDPVGGVTTTCSESGDTEVGYFTVKVVSFDKVQQEPFLVMKGNADVSISNFYSLSDNNVSERISATGDWVDNGLFRATAPEGSYTVGIMGDFDNGTKQLGVSIEVVDFRLTQGSSLDICSNSEGLIDLRDFHSLANKEGIIVSYSGTGVVDGHFLNTDILSEGTNTVTFRASGTMNGNKSLTMDFVKTPLPDITAGNFQFACQGNELLLGGGSPVGGIWSSEQLTVENGRVNTQGVAAGTYEVTYMVSEGNCSGSDTKTIEIRPLPFVDAGKDIGICSADGFLDLKSTDAFPDGGSWRTLEGGVVLNNGVLNLQTLFVPEEGVRELFVEYSFIDASGCENSDTKKVTVYQTPETPLISQTLICGSGQATLTVDNYDASWRYQWYEGNVAIPGENGRTLTTGILNASKIYRISASNPFEDECENFGEIEVRITLPPSRPIVQTVPQCGPGITTMEAGGISGASYKWYASNQAFLFEGNSYSEEIFQTTTYYVSAVVNGCEGEKAVVTATVYFQPPQPVVVDDERCGPGEVSLRATGLTSGGEFVWYADENNANPILTGQDVLVIGDLRVTTDYYVAVRMQDTGCESERVPITATIQPIPSAPAVEDGYICGDIGSVSLRVREPIAGFTYEWYSSLPATASGKVGEGSNYVTPLLIESAIYHVRAISPAACTSDFSPVRAIIVGDGDLDIGEDIEVCRFDGDFNLRETFPFSMSDALKEGGRFTGPGVFSGEIFSPNSLTAGTYEVRYTNTDLGGCEVVGTKEITIRDGAGSASISLPEDDVTLCASALPRDLSVFMGSYGGGSFSASDNNVDVFGTVIGKAPPGSYALTYTVEVNGCTYSPELKVEVLENLADIPSVVTDRNNYCPDDQVLLLASSNGADSYRWYDVNKNPIGEGTQLRIPANSTGVVLTEAIDANGCPSGTSRTTLEVPTLPDSIMVSSNVIQQYEAVSFLLDASDATDYFWQFEEGKTNAISYQKDPAYFFNEAGIFEVTVTVSTISGCERTLATTIMVGDEEADIITSAIGEIAKGIANVYPNPFGERLEIDLGMSTDKYLLDSYPAYWHLTDWHIYDTMGKRVGSGRLRNKGTVDTSTYPKGMYLLVLRNDDEMLTLKLMKL